MYKVKKEDLIGLLTGFPIEVVQLMLEYQFLQTGKTDISVFQKDHWSGLPAGGFFWEDTPKKKDFWYEVIIKKNFNLFFEKYPKNRDLLINLLEDWAAQKEKFKALSNTLKVIIYRIDRDIKEECGQEFKFPDVFFVGNWGWCLEGDLAKETGKAKIGFSNKSDYTTIFNLDIEDHWPISLKELKMLNERLYNLKIEELEAEIIKLNS
jgi:hypothetical protein